MDEMFIEHNKENCLYVTGNNVITIQSDNPGLTVYLGNKILNKEEIAEKYYSQADEIIQLLSHGKAINTKYIVYSNRVINGLDLEVLSVEQLMQKKVEKSIVILDQLSPDELIHFFSKKFLSTVFILVFQGEVLISMIPDRKSDFCQHCLLERFLYSRESKYKYKELWSSQAPSISTDSLKSLYLQVAINILREGNEQAAIVNRSNGDIIWSRVRSCEGCSLCYKGKIHDTGKVSLVTKNYKRQENGFRTLEAKQTSNLLMSLVNPLGPVIELEDDQLVDKLCLPVYQSSIGINPLLKGFRFHGGKGRTNIQAKFSAIGEAMERYNAQQFGNELGIATSFNELKKNKKVLNPRLLTLDPNYPTVYSDDLVIDWVPGINLNTDEKVWLPANAVFFVYHAKENSAEFMPQDTTGLASGTNEDEAILQGMLEVIERDAYTIYYRNKIQCSQILVSDIFDENIKSLVKNLKEKKINVNLKLLKTDLNVYVVHCTTEDEEKHFPIYTHGAGASLNILVAISRAITECVQLRTSQLKIEKHKELFTNDLEYQPYLSWGNGDKEAVYPFLNGYADEIVDLTKCVDLSTGDLKGDIEYMVNDLSRHGFTVYCASLSRDDNPIATTRTIIPGLQPADDTLRRNTERMDSVSKLLNSNCSGKLNERRLFS